MKKSHRMTIGLCIFLVAVIFGIGPVASLGGPIEDIEGTILPNVITVMEHMPRIAVDANFEDKIFEPEDPDAAGYQNHKPFWWIPW